MQGFYCKTNFVLRLPPLKMHAHKMRGRERQLNWGNSWPPINGEFSSVNLRWL